MTNSHVVIMAGGSGTRFWPLSRSTRPKQLLSLTSHESLLQETYRRIRSIVPADHVWIVTSELLAHDVRTQLPEVPESNILAEPVGRNTAPCIGWAAAHIRRKNAKATIAVLPADHHIGDETEYTRVMTHGLSACANGEFVTVGIVPTRPETGYGYIEEGAAAPASGSNTQDRQAVHRVTRFVEKPQLDKAKEFIKRGNFLWNSGIFFFRADAILAAIEKHLPEMHAQLTQYDAAAKLGSETQLVQKTYASIQSISIDYGIMEKVDNTFVIRGDFGWSDLGSWTTAWELAEKDSDGNVQDANTLVLDSTNCYIKSDSERLIAIVGLQDMVVVDTKDALLVLPRERAQDVKFIVESLKKTGSTELL